MSRIPIPCLLVGRAPDTPAMRRLHAACEAAGLAPRRVDVAGAVDPRLDRPPHAPFPARMLRLPSGTPWHELSALLAAREREGDAAAPWLDEPLALLRTHDKGRQLANLAAAGLPVPPTVRVGRDGRVDESALEGEQLVVKPVLGAAGRGVAPALPRAQARRRARDFARLSTPVLVQPWLGGGVDRRLFMVDGELVAAMQRTPAPGDGRGNASRGARATPWAPRDEHLALARAATAALGLAIAGVDLLETDAGPVLLEVNAAPGFAALEAATGADVAGALAAALARRAGAD